MIRKLRFQARIEPVERGGHYVVVPAEAAAKAQLEHGLRVRGSVAGTPYRSALVKRDEVFYLGVHKVTLAQANKRAGDTVPVELEPDDEPLPEDTVPEILTAALAKQRAASAAWAALAPSHRREHVRYINGAKRDETRVARVERTLAMLLTPKKKPPKPDSQN